MNIITHNKQQIQTVKNNGNSSLFFQPKLTINNPNDKYEQEADAMADKVMRMEQPQVQLKPLPITPVQRKCEHCEEEEKKMQRKEINGEEKTADNNLENYVGGLQSGGQPLPNETRNFYEPRFGYDFSNVKLHTDTVAAKSAQSINALAYTSGNNIVFNEGQYSPNSDIGKRLLGHELTHVVQQNNIIKRKIIQRNEKDKRVQSPQDKVTVEIAKAKLAKLEPLLQKAEDRQLSIEVGRLRILAARKRIDDNAADLNMPGKRATEENNLANLNKLPINISQNDSDIVVTIKFQAFFEDASMKDKFDTLKTNVQAGINLVWNHTLTDEVFGGKKFSIIPSFTLIDNRVARKHDFWLINIRKVNKGKAIYPGCSLPQPDPDIPTSITDPLCDGGIISIPPLHITLPGVLGHELLHLFGLVDRYFTVTSIKPGKGKVFEDEPVRETGGRKDPLGAQDGTILMEDLGYLFDKLGIYKNENTRNEAIIAYAKPEVRRLKRIVELGYDPDSLLPVRKDFTDKIIKSAEDL